MIWTMTLYFLHFKSPICHGNSKCIHEIHAMCVTDVNNKHHLPLNGIHPQCSSIIPS